MDEEDLAQHRGPSDLVARSGFARRGATAASGEGEAGGAPSDADRERRHSAGGAAALASLLSVS